MTYGNNMLAFFSVGPTEIVIMLVVGLLVFGNRLPEVGKSLGKGVIEFKKGLRGIQDEIDQADQTTENNPRSE